MTLFSTTRIIGAGLIVAAFGLNLSPVGYWGMSAAYAQSEALRPDVGKPLQAAQELMKNKKYKEALAKVHEAEAIANKTPYESFTIDRMRGAAAANLGDADLAAKSFDAVINSGRLPAAEQVKLMEAIAGTFYRAKEYGKAANWAQRALKADAGNTPMRTLLIQSQYMRGDYLSAAKELSAEFQADDKAGRVSSEERLQLQASCYLKLKDVAGYVSVLERLVAHYPKKDYWADLIPRIENKPGFANRLSLEVYRLELATGTLSAANRYMEMAQLLIQAGFPVEAKKVIDKGYADGTLGSGTEAERQKRLRDLVYKQAADDAKSPGEGEEQAKAAKTGDGLLNVGYNYVVNGQFDKGLALMEQGMAKGALKRPDDAKLHLGIAYLQAGNKAKASQVLKTVQGNDGTADLAKLWLRVQ